MDHHVLVLEHNDRLRDTICLHMTLGGYACDGVANATDGMRVLSQRDVDLVVMDLTIPPGPGIETCQRVRNAASSSTPILLLASGAGDTDALTALEQRCADDFMAKPLSQCELIARARALIRRTGRQSTLPDAEPRVVCGDLAIDPARRRVQIKTIDIKTTDQEFRLLYLLASRAEVVFTRQDLLTAIWGRETFVSTRSVDALVKRVRRRIIAAGTASTLLTVHGVGYKFLGDPWETSA